MTQEVIDAMRLVVDWQEMYDQCKEREHCLGCGYLESRSCDLISTEAMIKTVSGIFKKHIEGA